MENIVRSNIISNNLLKHNENVVIGVSGGPDSMALLYILLDIKKEIGFNIIIAHVNHGVRGLEAKADQSFVERKANELGLPFFTIDVDMIEYGKKKGITSEEAGRELRYGFFREVLRKNGDGGKIAVAHNKNDQAETLLLRIMRGTGIDGLNGMGFISEDIIRPLLNISRKDIEEYIRINNIETVLDKTNLESIYSRNKVRLELIPYIEANFNPNIINTLWRMSNLSAIDSECLESMAIKKYNLLVKKETKNSIILDGTNFLNESICIQQRVVRKAILNLVGNLQGFSEQHISSLINLFKGKQTGKKINLPQDIIGRVSYDDLIIEANSMSLDGEFNYSVDMGNNEYNDLGFSVNLSLIDAAMDIESKKNIKYFDYDLIKGNLKIRNRRSGDKFIPLGMKGRKKIKDFLIDEKVPRDLRDSIPLLVDDENILWIIGYQTSELYRVTNNTKRVLRVEYNT